MQNLSDVPNVLISAGVEKKGFENMNVHDVIVIGGGPAGLICAASCATHQKKVALLEKNATFGKKLLITGAGKCNLTQEGEIGAFLHHYGTNSRFVKPCLYAFSNVDFRNFLHQKKLPTVSVENRKVFPQSMKASDVVDTLEAACRSERVALHTNTAVTGITQKDDLFEVVTNRATFYSKHLVISTGGVTYPQTGSTGDGHVFAKNFGHKIRPTKFALAPLIVKNFELSPFSGLSFERLSFTHWRDGKKINSYSGDALITHRGFSGPGMMNASRYIEKDDWIHINFLSMAKLDSYESLSAWLVEQLTTNKKRLVRSVVNEWGLPKRLMDFFLKKAGVSDQLRCSELTKKTRSTLLTLITSYPAEIKRVGSAETAMVTAGGVDLSEVSPKTMASRKVDRLYFAGEVLDVDGDTGGYNIQAAVSMGYLASETIRKKEETHP